MAVYERTYRKYEGPLTPEWSRFLVLPSYSYQEVFKSKLFLLFYAVSGGLWPFALAVIIYLPHNLGFLKRIQAQAVDITSFFQYDAEFFFYWFMVPSLLTSFLVAFIVGPALISADLRNNGLPLYLARPFGRAEYVLGKTTVLMVLLSGVNWVPGLLLFLLQSYLAGWSWFTGHLRVGFAIFVGSWIWILILCLLSLAVSAYVKWKPIARLVMVLIYFVAAFMAVMINTILRTDWGSLVNLADMVRIVWTSLFGIAAENTIPTYAAWLSLLTLCAGCLLLLSRKVRAYEVVRS